MSANWSLWVLKTKW